MENTNYEKGLNELLSSYQMHYQNLRSLHWNIRGINFFELHAKYEELYTRAQDIVDEVAERILSIGGRPISRFSDYIKHSKIAELGMVIGDSEGVDYILSAQTQLLSLEQTLLASSGDREDEGTNSLISDLIREKEKTNWMFKAWLNK